ncbi:hypothetical protein GCM10027605_70300 [Micromonospora zhanjiangensis]
MSGTNQPTVVGRGLGGELRELRRTRGLPQRQVAIRLGWQPSKLSRIEAGIQGVQAADVASLLVIYGVTGDERKRLLGMAERSAETGWWEAIGGLSDESRTLIRLEAEATGIVNWQPLLVPGLLQIPDYSHAVMAGCGVPEDEAQSRVAARLGRQAILSRPTPPVVHAMIDEMVLRRVLGGTRVMVRQLRHLLDAAERPTSRSRWCRWPSAGIPGWTGRSRSSTSRATDRWSTWTTNWPGCSWRRRRR